MKPRRHLQLKQPRLAELIAVNLRDRILASEFADGANLPKQEDLLDEFGVSPPSIREALRILETEGLVSVKRGNVGGAVVLQPKVEKVAYMLALVMQASSVSLGDVSHALVQLEIPCAAEWRDALTGIAPSYLDFGPSWTRAGPSSTYRPTTWPRRAGSTRKWSTAAATRP